METPIKGRKFIELRDHWYERLKDEGFTEIEEIKKGSPYLRVWHHSYFQSRYTPARFKIKQRYYRLVCQFQADHNFQSELEETVWALHCEGLPMRRISERLQIKTCQVLKVILDIRQQMIQALRQEEPVI